ncbi:MULTISPECIES: DUF3012 domain-containing protein [unclassified Thioalkalivibrio]|uniref:DUF3012 domain-containing protein n=1 Tax=unclassified Thioalkalivibrio TaxID=2621013 RepID=UPI00037249BF|nr:MULTISPECIES: DUF3012 domain-containing protein [unclassified Thioalkalivibrio]
MITQRWVALAALMILLPLGCGTEQTADADPVAAESLALDAGMVADRVLANLHDQAAVFEAIGDELEAVDDQAAADALGRRLAGEYTARMIAQMEEMVVWAETHLVPVDAAERAVIDQELEALFAASDRFQAAEMRFDRATERVGGRLEALMLRDPRQGHAVLEGMLALGDQVEAFMTDERMVAMDLLMAPEPEPQPVEAAPASRVGSPAWCERMANTPQAQWTMNDAFAFANHCTGG